MSGRFDADQERAYRADRNAVIMAGAGSGKTSVLVERYCWLLAERGAAVDEILALTFTRKAAAEMYERIYARLQESPLDHVRHQLQRFDRAQISTLDSFCSQVVRNASELFGLAPDFRYDEEEVRRCAERAALDYLLAHLDDPALRALLDLHGFDELLAGLFVSLALEELHLARDIDFPGLGRRQIEACRRLLAEHLAAFRAAAAGVLGLEARTASIRAAQEALQAAGTWPELEAAGRYRELAERCRELALKKPGGRAAADILALKSGLDRLREEQALIAALADTLAREELLAGSMAHLQAFQAQFNRRKRESGLVSFRDIAEMAVRALVENKGLRRFYKARFRHIMIDEFQDNNRLQKDLLYLLSEKAELSLDAVPEAGQLEAGKLFFVGDEKQSIYRFRGADVGVFKALSRELVERGGLQVTLDRNYRSDPGLIGFFNRLFSVLLARGEESYEARFQELLPGRPPASDGAEIRILYQPHRPGAAGQEEGFLSREENEAFAVAAAVREAVESGRLKVRDGEDARPARYEDFAVLLRSTGNQIVYERMFRHFRIPYSTQSARSLYLEAPLNDLYHLLQLCLWPEDRLSYAALLRSPLVGLPDLALLEVLRAREAPFRLPGDAKLEPADRDRLARGGALLASFRELADTRPLTELVTRFWYESGYRFLVLRDPRFHSYLELHEAMLALARAAQRRGDNLAAFLDFLRPRLGTPEKAEEPEGAASRRAGVQLLTIHRAKGLEFPVVVLADTGNRGRDHEAGQPYTVSDELGITLRVGAGDYFTLRGREERDKKEIAELKRLFYVALTRAQSHLWIAGSHNAGNRASPKALLNLLFSGLGLDAGAAAGPAASPPAAQAGKPWRLEEIGPVSEERFLRRPAAERRAAPDPQALRAGYARAEVVRRPAGRRREYTVSELSALLAEAEAEKAAGAAKPAESAVELPALAVDPVLRAEGLERAFGSLVHALLAARLTTPPGAVSGPPWLELGIPPRFRSSLLDAAVELSERFFASELGRLAAAADRIEVEQPFLRRVGEVTVSGQIDLLFRCGERTLLVDFKSDRVLRRGEHMAQLGLYRPAARELWGRDPECRLFLLRSGETLVLDDGVDWEARLAALLAAPPEAGGPGRLPPSP